MNIRVDGQKLMLSQEFAVPVSELYNAFTVPESIVTWFKANERFTTKYTWGFVCSNGTPDAGLCFGNFGDELPALKTIATMEEKAKLPNFADHSQTPSVGCPVITAWCQDANEKSSRLWLRHVFASDNECHEFSKSPYVKFWDEQLSKLAALLNRPSENGADSQ